MITCSKSYFDIPLSHRQPLHSGRCSRLHGHSWSITLTFASKKLDSNGFVVDFGKLNYISDWIDKNLDHGTIVCQSDPRIDELHSLAKSGLLKITEIKSASCEGIAEFLFHTFDQLVRKNTEDRAWLVKIHLMEDSKKLLNIQTGFTPVNELPVYERFHSWQEKVFTLANLLFSYAYMDAPFNAHGAIQLALGIRNTNQKTSTDSNLSN